MQLQRFDFKIVYKKGKDTAEHANKLQLIMDRARQINLKFNPDNCKFRVPEVTYVGHVFTPDGLKPDPKKTAAFIEIPAPTDVFRLQRFLGMVNYLGKFIPNLSEPSTDRASNSIFCPRCKKLVLADTAR